MRDVSFKTQLLEDSEMKHLCDMEFNEAKLMCLQAQIQLEIVEIRLRKAALERRIIDKEVAERAVENVSAPTPPTGFFGSIIKFFRRN